MITTIGLDNIHHLCCCSVASNSVRRHGLQHIRLRCPSTTPGACRNWRPSSRICHPTISSSVIPFSSCLQSLPASVCFLVSWHFASGGQNIGASASASVLPMNTQDCSPFRMDWLDLLANQGALKNLLQHHSSKASILQCSAFFMAQLSHPYMTTGKAIALTRWKFLSKVNSLLFNTMSRLVSFSSKEQASFNFKAVVTIYSDFGTPPNKLCHCFHWFPIYVPWNDGNRWHDLHFLNVEF